MTSIASSSVSIQTSAHSAPSPPSLFGEGALLSQYLRKPGVLAAISAQVRFARRRFGRFEVIDFVVVLFGYAERRRTHAGSLLQAAASIRCRLHGAQKTFQRSCPAACYATRKSKWERATRQKEK